LDLVSVQSSSSSCPELSFQVFGDRVQARWSPNTPGYQECSVDFAVQDAQGRQGTGTIGFSLQGKAQQPQSVSQTGYGDGKAKIRISRGPQSFPAVSGYRVVYNG